MAGERHFFISINKIMLTLTVSEAIYVQKTSNKRFSLKYIRQKIYFPKQPISPYLSCHKFRYNAISSFNAVAELEVDVKSQGIRSDFSTEREREIETEKGIERNGNKEQ